LGYIGISSNGDTIELLVAKVSILRGSLVIWGMIHSLNIFTTIFFEWLETCRTDEQAGIAQQWTDFFLKSIFDNSNFEHL
jgi:hypothetical protein